ncbi:phage tail protein [Actinocrispum wychmicini]|uniref:Phage tail-like protein n=1 Tax=Actinocrispum wychmicini TaxID=1213861 RepID=A0A4R2JBM1_9PSEU|nr:phage tail protein [Actinocrispum wychmicini]TCO55777.1 phage tail-like protein [Actinocrispum wychmicini]
MTAPAGNDALITHRFGVQLGGITVESIQEISGLTVDQAVVEVPGVTSTGRPFIKKQPGATKGGEVTITRNLDPSSAFSDWIKQTLNEGAIKAARQNLTIEFMDNQGNTVRRIQLMNAWASKWEGPGLKAGDSTGATEKVTITFEEIQVQ